MRSKKAVQLPEPMTGVAPAGACLQDRWRSRSSHIGGVSFEVRALVSQGLRIASAESIASKRVRLGAPFETLKPVCGRHRYKIKQVDNVTIAGHVGAERSFHLWLLNLIAGMSSPVAMRTPDIAVPNAGDAGMSRAMTKQAMPTG